MKLETIMKDNELSLRQVSLNLDINYNMLLKAAKKPIIGIPYDPTFINYTEVETYIAKHCNLDDIDWSSMKDSSTVSNMKLPTNLEVGSHFSIRGEDDTFEMRIVTPTHVCFMPLNGTQPRVMSIATFLHQGPKEVK
jgi:hypothetical protein